VCTTAFRSRTNNSVHSPGPELTTVHILPVLNHNGPHTGENYQRAAHRRELSTGRTTKSYQQAAQRRVINGPHIGRIINGPHIGGIINGPHIPEVINGPHIPEVINGPHTQGG